MQEILKKLYEVDKLTTRQIAPMIGKSPRTVTRLLHKFGIAVRPPGPEHHEFLRDAKWLYTQYVELEKSLPVLEKETGASTGVIRHWMKVHGISRRRVGVHKPYERTEQHRAATSARSKMFIGSANPNYKGGRKREDKTLRSSYQSKAWARQVKDRDNWRCVDCGAVENLHAHHLQSWRHHPELRFDLSNGVTVCVKCHEKRHGRNFPEWLHQKAEITTSTNPRKGEDIV